MVNFESRYRSQPHYGHKHVSWFTRYEIRTEGWLLYEEGKNLVRNEQLNTY